MSEPHIEYKYLIRYQALHFTHDADLIEDLMQVARIALYRSAATRIEDPHKRRVYVIKTAKGVMLRYMRRVNPLIFVPEVPRQKGLTFFTSLFCELPEYRQEQIHAVNYDLMTKIELQRAMRKLSPDCARIIQLRLRDYTDLEIIETLHMSKYYFQICRNAALQTLRMELRDEDYFNVQ